MLVLQQEGGYQMRQRQSKRWWFEWQKRKKNFKFAIKLYQRKTCYLLLLLSSKTFEVQFFIVDDGLRDKIFEKKKTIFLTVHCV